jgi:hypothetical protein
MTLLLCSYNWHFKSSLLLVDNAKEPTLRAGHHELLHSERLRSNPKILDYPKKLVGDIHSSLFETISVKKKKVYNIGTSGQCYKTFIFFTGEDAK